MKNTTGNEDHMKAANQVYKITAAGARKAMLAGDAEALEGILKQLPDEGGAELQNELGMLFRDQKDRRAITWFKKAIDLGCADAENNLGGLYFSGVIVGTNAPKAVVLFKAAAQKGEVRAMFNMGLAYHIGAGVKKNFAKAAEWYMMAAESRHALAVCHLGIMHFSGMGVERDFKKAMELFRRSAELGCSDAELRIGRMYRVGLGVEQSNRNAAKWMKRAWEHGNEDAGELMNHLFYKTRDSLFDGEWLLATAE